MFDLINAAKNLGSYSLANAAFAALIDVALDNEKKYFFVYEDSRDDDSYYDLVVISDGVREACIPVPLLRNPASAYISISKEVRPKRSHERKGKIVSHQALEKELKDLRNKILEIPDLQQICKKYLMLEPNIGTKGRIKKKKKEGDCTVCPYYARGHNKGAIHCTVHPAGYPSQSMCDDWELDIALDEALMYQQRIAEEALYKEQARLARVAENLAEFRRKVEKAKEELPKLKKEKVSIEFALSRLEKIEREGILEVTEDLKDLPKWIYLFQGYGESQPQNEEVENEKKFGSYASQSLYGHIVVSRWTGLRVYARVLHKIPELENEPDGFWHFLHIPLLEWKNNSPLYEELRCYYRRPTQEALDFIFSHVRLLSKDDIEIALKKRIEANRKCWNSRLSRCSEEIAKAEKILDLVNGQI